MWWTSVPVMALYQSATAKPLKKAAPARKAYVVNSQLPARKRTVRLWKSRIQRAKKPRRSSVELFVVAVDIAVLFRTAGP